MQTGHRPALTWPRWSALICLSASVRRASMREVGLRPSVGARTTWGGYFIAELPAQGDKGVRGRGGAGWHRKCIHKWGWPILGTQSPRKVRRISQWRGEGAVLSVRSWAGWGRKSHGVVGEAQSWVSEAEQWKGGHPCRRPAWHRVLEPKQGEDGVHAVGLSYVRSQNLSGNFAGERGWWRWCKIGYITKHTKDEWSHVSHCQRKALQTWLE